MKLWNFKVFLRDKTVNDIDEWLKLQPVKVRVKMRSIIAHLEITQNWPIQYFCNWVGSDNLYELKITYNNVQYRPLGFFGPGIREFTILIGAKEIGNKLDPKAAPYIAEKRRELAIQDRRYIDDFA